LWRPIAMQRSARLAALFVMHRRPSSRTRARRLQRLGLYRMAFGGLAVGGQFRLVRLPPKLQFGHEQPAELGAPADTPTAARR
jgi:hypothetical protein